MTRKAKLAATALFATAVALSQLAVGTSAQAAPPPTAQWYKQLQIEKSWKYSKGAGVTVAVIDSGVKASIPELRGQVLAGQDYSGVDPNGQHEDPIKGEGDYGHGTAMATLIAGREDSAFPGIAPAAKILPIDADKQGTSSRPSGALSGKSTNAGIRWAVDHGADIINLSLGDVGGCSPDDQAAVAYAYEHDVLVLAATGNDGGTVSTPADCYGAIAVGAIDTSFRPWSGSAHGPELDFVNQGVGMTDVLLDGSVSTPKEATSNGTSGATAITSGVFALLKAKFPHDTVPQLIARATYHVHSGLGKGSEGTRIDDRLGYGVILPIFALTESTPADPKNPIVDRAVAGIKKFHTDFPSYGSSSSAPARPTDSPYTPSHPPGASDASSGDSGMNPLPLILIGVVVVAAAVAITFAVRGGRRGRRPPPPGPGPYYPPPPGPGPYRPG